MAAYLARKLLLMIPTILGIVVLTFILFRVVAPDPAMVLAGKMKSPNQLEALRARLGTDRPRWLNFAAAREHGFWHVFDSQFFNVLAFRFRPSYRTNESVWELMARKAPVSLAIQLPAFFIELGLQLAIALYTASRRGKPVDYVVTFLSVLGMSVPALSIYIGAQYLFGGYLRWFPIAGWSPGFFYAIHFAALPILVSVIVGLGWGTRFYRTTTLEEIGNDYVRTARAKGVAGSDVMLTHVFRNVLIPVVTNTVVALPFLITGALLLERLFQIPGMGGLLVDAIHTQDEPVVMAVVYVTAVAYCLMLVLTDLLYSWVDPRVALK
ncbi:MAG TPA: ABC transporter permease [Humisphaera sp.]|jgi:peptide/nickel transport system permease protein|nr:ABC transporter permease [Humisphaera sp.]